jgi:hypothetical protein
MIREVNTRMALLWDYAIRYRGKSGRIIPESPVLATTNRVGCSLSPHPQLPVAARVSASSRLSAFNADTNFAAMQLTTPHKKKALRVRRAFIEAKR